MSNTRIDECTRKHGHGRSEARLGPRSGSCYTPTRTGQTAARHAEEGLQEVRFRFDFEGTKVIAS